MQHLREFEMFAKSNRLRINERFIDASVLTAFEYHGPDIPLSLSLLRLYYYINKSFTSLSFLLDCALGALAAVSSDAHRARDCRRRKRYKSKSRAKVARALSSLSVLTTREKSAVLPFSPFLIFGHGARARRAFGATFPGSYFN